MRAAWMEGGGECTVEHLKAEGVLTERFDVNAHRDAVGRLKTERKYVHHDDIALSGVDPKDEAKIAREADEHAHMEDEVRFIVEGAGNYEVRARNERWMHIEVAAGDLIVIPAKRYHRFLLSSIRFVQPYAERSDLIPLYKASDDDTRC